MPIVLPDVRIAIKNAWAKSDIAIHKMAAIVFTRNGRVLGVASNKRGNGYVSEYSYHAEEMVLDKTAYARREARKKKTKVYLLVVRINKRGELRLAAPCYPCYQMCRSAGIEKIFYTTDMEIRSI